MHSTTATIAHAPTRRRVSGFGAAALAIAGNMLVVAILAAAALGVLAAAAVVFGGSVLEAL